LGLLDGLAAQLPGNEFLERLEGLVDWAPFRRDLESLFSATTGRLPRLPLVLSKMLLLQHCYGPSDPQCPATNRALFWSFRASIASRSREGQSKTWKSYSTPSSVGCAVSRIPRVLSNHASRPPRACGTGDRFAPTSGREPIAGMRLDPAHRPNLPKGKTIMEWGK
jgi:hypothetical protein